VTRQAGPSTAVVAAVLLTAACAATGDSPGVGDELRVRVPPGASFRAVADTLAADGIVRFPTAFRLYARATGAAGRIRPGTYGFRRGAGWRHVLDALVAGRVLTTRLVIPEGLDTGGIAARIAEMTGADADSLRAQLRDPALAARLDVPGPGLEGYLYPATYTLPVDATVDAVIAQLVERYRRVWTDERRARAEARGLTEREVVTLASIIEKEARRAEEMPLIAAVFHNRLRIGMPLQADPTVQYALGVHRERLLYAAIDSVADNPYNTYRHRGLPPGPIASPGERAIDAALEPADAPYLYFVARPDGTHIFTRTLAEHNRARVEARRLRDGTGPDQP
jgi:UPF0755 protein